MITGLTRLSSFSFQLSVAFVAFSLFSLPAHSENFIGASYQAKPAHTDYRSVSTLNDFTRMVYRDRWSNIDADYVLEQFSKFKLPPNSPAMRDIWRDVLLGDFNGLNFSNDTQQTMLMAERIRLLNRLGFFDEAVRLYQKAAEHKPIPEPIVVQGVEAMALAGSADGACLEVYMATKYLAGEDWNKDAALCAAYFGDKKLAENLYGQVKATDAFDTVYKMLGSSGGKAIHVGIPALWRTLLLAQGATVTPQALEKADATTLGALAVNPHVPLGTRLSAANRAGNLGTIGFERLRTLYEAKHPSETGIEGLVASAKAGQVMPPSDYYAAARFTFEGNERATIVKNAMHALHPITNIKSQVYGWIVDKLTLQVTKLGWFAPEGFAAMATTNRIASAEMYYEAGNLGHSPLALVNALLQGKPWTADQDKAWEDAMHSIYKDKADAKIDMMMRVAKAYDQENKLGLQTTKNQGRSQSVLQNSIRNGGRGLTLVTALNLLSEKTKLKDLSTDQFVDIVTNMSQEGLFGERKKITLEFLIQSVL